jgi:hypothetical protein
MWTCPIILLATQPAGSILVAAFRRGGVVILGALVGWAFHWVAENIVDALAGTEPAPNPDPPQTEGGAR